MHPRHRSPGNGYRSNPMGMSMGPRISPENMGRGGHGFYNSEYRSFNRSFGRGHSQPKPFHPPPAPPPPPQQPPVAAVPLRKADIFLEAGRLAAEYLVSQGILPPGALTGKWQNGNIKGFQEEGDSGRNMQFPVDGGRSSAMARLQDSGSDLRSGRRRYPDEYESAGSRNYMKGKRRGGSFRGYNNSEWGRDYGRSSSWSDKRRGSPEYDSGTQEEQLGTKNDSTSSMEKSTNEVVKSEDGGAQESETKENESRTTSSKDVQDETSVGGGGPINTNEESSLSKENTEKVKGKDIIGDEETEKEIIQEELPKNKSSEKVDLQSLCKFVNMPTRMRSVRGPRMGEEEKNSDAGTSQVSEVSIEDKAVDGSMNNISDTRDLVTRQAAEVVNLVDKSLVVDDNNQLNEKRGEKRATEDVNTDEESKRAREWLPSVVADVAGGATTEEKLITVNDQHKQESAENKPRTSEIGQTSYAQEKQLFPGSFKICDLNLMESNDVNEAAHDRDSIFIYPPISDFKKEGGPVDIDLSISNSSMSTQHVKQVDISDRAIEVIDLDEDSPSEDRRFDIPERKPDVAFTGLDGFSTNPVQSATDIPDNQDGYGLMISEYFANEFAGCSSVPGINPLDNMGLNGGAGPLGDDDPIYMSLGEIPFLSFMRTWEQPPQQDGKPF